MRNLTIAEVERVTSTFKWCTVQGTLVLAGRAAIQMMIKKGVATEDQLANTLELLTEFITRIFEVQATARLFVLGRVDWDSVDHEMDRVVKEMPDMETIKRIVEAEHIAYRVSRGKDK